MKNKLLLFSAILFIGCGTKEQKDKYEIIQEIDNNFLYTFIKVDDAGLFKDYPYFEGVEIDSTTNVKSEYLKAKKVLIRYKELENEIHNINK